MDVSESFIEAHQIPFPAFGDELVDTPFTIEFSPALADIDVLLEDVFNGGEPFYMPGECRPVTPDCDQYAVGAVACPLPEDGDEKTYDVHYPLDHTVWFDVTAEEMQVYIRDTVDAARMKHFCDTLDAAYGVELHEVVDLPAVREQVLPEDE